MSGFQKAQRFSTNPTIAITGPTGSGKTYSALRLASGISKAMGKPFALIDTENGSASLYSDVFEFDTLNIKPPFTTEKYIEAIKTAEKAGYCALVVDSITHAWAGEGGLLEQKAQLDARPGSNHWTNWGPIKTKDQKFKNAYLHSSIPFFIATMRSKMEYAQTENNGKKKVEKQGMAPVQSDGIEYEFSIVLDVAMNHEAEVSKDRTGIFAKDPIFQVNESVGEQLVSWRNSGKAKAPPAAAPKTPPPAHQDQPQSHPPDDVPDHNPDDLESYLGGPESAIEAAGQFKISFGPYKDRLINAVPPPHMKSYIEFLEKQAFDQNKAIDPKGPVGQLIANAEIFLDTVPGDL